MSAFDSSTLIRSAVLAAILVLPQFTLGQAAEKQERGRAIIVLDASGSMWGQVEGRAKIEVAREVLQKLVTPLPGNLDLGLMAYGHRRESDCADIELLIPPGTVDRRAFLRKALNIVPKGKTPLTAAVEMAAEALAYKEKAATVILVSDGLENCERDPCELAVLLKRQGVAFRAHVIAFDLLAKDAESFRCLADETGGRFLPAQDAASLGDALQIAVAEAASPPQPPAPTRAPSPLVQVPVAELTAPDNVVMGTVFEVGWKGPNNPGDFITVISPSAKEKEYGNYTYTRRGNPLELVAPITPGVYELRYVVNLNSTSRVAGRRSIKVIEGEFVIKPPAEVQAGSFAEIEWSGPRGNGDYLTIVEPTAKEGQYGHYAYARHGSPAKIRVPGDAGEYQIRYLSGQGGKTLAKAPIKVTPAQATLNAVSEAMAGSVVKVEWTGPAASGDWITVVTPDAPPRKYNQYAYARKGNNPVRLEMPAKPGEYELRYVAAAVERVLARVPITVTDAKVSVSAPESSVAGAEIEVDWIGPAGAADQVVLVPANHTGKRDYLKNWRAEKGSPAVLLSPETPGAFEVRYVNREGETLAKQAVALTEPTATLNGPKVLKIYEKFTLKWTGPNNPSDRVVLVPKSEPDRTISNGVSARSGSPQIMSAPSKPGEYELRYVTGQLRGVLARQPVIVSGER